MHASRTATTFLLALVAWWGDAAADEHWAYRPSVRPTVPATGAGSIVRSPVDAFLLTRREAARVPVAAPAEPAILLRRLAIALTGLPPEPDEIAEFMDDPSEGAYERWVDRYLASPQYGPRWGKFWLDAAGYADSNGYFSADTDRPWAWRYRDYVVASHNADVPFDQLVREQLAGDELSGYVPGQPVTAAMRDALIATHYLRNAPDGTGESDGNPDEVRVDRYTVLEGTAQILGASLLGLTVQCGKCHDHKFEALTQREYYQLQAILYPAYDVERWVKPGDRVVEIESQKISWLSDIDANPPPVRLLERGDPKHPGVVVEPGVPAALHDERAPFRIEAPASGRTTGRRTALARWLTAPDSRAAALVARVTVNRLWQHHFGTGIVATPENFGMSGAAPSHPELLEYLAAELQAHGWSLKHIQRLIVTSDAYRRSSRRSDEARRLDPNGRLLASFPLQRLTADALRDSLLAASGELDRQLGGPYVPTQRSGVGAVSADEKQPGYRRRSIYLQQRRTQVDSLLATFDAPSIVTSCPRRPTTTTPLQSLEQLNGGLVRGRASALAARLLALQSNDPDERVTLAFLRTAGRPPTREERTACDEFLRRQVAEYPGDSAASARSWVDLCQVLLAGNALLYVE